jgi:hypothetical protein
MNGPSTFCASWRPLLPSSSRVLERFEPAEGHVGPIGVTAVAVVEQVVRDEQRDADGQPAAVPEVVHGPADDLDGAGVGRVGVLLQVGHEQLDGPHVGGDGRAQPRGEIRRQE